MTTALLGHAVLAHAVLTGVLLTAFVAVVAVQWARPRCARVLRGALAVLRTAVRTASRPAVTRT